MAFAPQICVPGSDAIRYCYDPGQIEAIRDRVDCLVSLYLAHKEDLGDGAAGERGDRGEERGRAEHRRGNLRTARVRTSQAS